MDGQSRLGHNSVVSSAAMSSAQNTLAVVIVLVCFGFVCGNDKDLRRIDAIQSEQPCLQAGGMCVIATDCPNGQLSEQRGLCPKQRDQGVECCYGISMKETRCGKRGGVCMPSKDFCNKRLLFEEATDCSDDEHCCIMVS